MTIGRDLEANSTIMKIITKVFGTLSLHMQLRLGNVYKVVKKEIDSLNVLDIGCGGGSNYLELRKRVNQLGYIGVDITIEKVSKYSDPHTVFIEDDGFHFLKNNILEFDIIFLLDILEHIPNPKEVLRLCRERLNENGAILISVPTPNYPKVFGRRWHEEIGHLVDGYTIKDINEMMGQEPVYYKYHTGLIARFGCWLEYNKLNFKNNKLNLIKQLVLYPFKWLDVINNEKVSCSLFAVYRR